MACTCQGATVNSCGSCSMDCVNEGDSCGPIGCGTCSEGGGGATLCFVAGTKVTMADGTEKNIEEIEIGDEVKSWNAVTNEFESNKVTKLISPIHDDMVVLTWEHTSVKSTFDHPFWSVVDNDWASYKPELTKERYEFCNIEQLVVGNKGLFLTDDGVIESELISIEEDMGEVQTYIFELDNNNTFFANGIATHNKSTGGPGQGPPAQPVPIAPPKPWSVVPGGKKIPTVYSRTQGRNTACPKGYRMQRGVCKEVNRTTNVMGRINQGPVGAHAGSPECCYTGCGTFQAWVECTNGNPTGFYANTAGTIAATGCSRGCELGGDGTLVGACIGAQSATYGTAEDICGSWQTCSCRCPVENCEDTSIAPTGQVAPPKGEFRRGGRISGTQRRTSKSRVQLNNNRNWIQVNSTTFKWNGNGPAPTAHGYYITCRDHDNQVSHQIECHVSHTGASMHDDCPNPPCYDYGHDVAVCDGACHGEQVGISPIARVGGRIRRRRRR